MSEATSALAFFHEMLSKPLVLTRADPQPPSFAVDSSVYSVLERLVPHAAASETLMTDEFPQIGTPAWGQMNRRRAELIRKKNRGGLNAAEFAEFEYLQRRSLEAVDRIYPLQGEDEEREG